MGKRFVTRSRQEWEALLLRDSTNANQVQVSASAWLHARDSTNANQVQVSASAWLHARLEGYVQSNPDAPITLAVPDRFATILGDAPEETMAESLPGTA
jgi:hypothetical protein